MHGKSGPDSPALLSDHWSTHHFSGIQAGRIHFYQLLHHSQLTLLDCFHAWFTIFLYTSVIISDLNMTADILIHWCLTPFTPLTFSSSNHQSIMNTSHIFNLNPTPSRSKTFSLSMSWLYRSYNPLSLFLNLSFCCDWALCLLIF